ncbi:MAG: hypothetical protein WAR01_03055, partial [Dokdonella sp.]
MQHFDFEQAQFAVGDDEEVAAATSGIEKAQAGELDVEALELAFVVADFFQFGFQFVEEQRADQLQDVLFAGVVRAQVAPGLGIHDRLEHRAEDGRADAAPVERAGLQQQLAHVGVESGQRQRFREQLAVDVGEFGELRVEG